MKKIISCFLSCILLLQTLVYSQTMYPTRQKVEDIYNKVYDRVNTSPALKKFKNNEEITPIIAMSAIANVVVTFYTPQELEHWLTEFGIEKDVHAPVYEILEEAYNTLKIEREMNVIGLESRIKVAEESIQLIKQATESDPNILRYYYDYRIALIKKQESNKLGINISENIRISLSQFEMACQKAKITPAQFIQAFKNCEEILYPTQKQLQTDLLVQFVNKLSTYAGHYDISLLMEETMEAADALSEEESIDFLIEENNKRSAQYSKEYFEAKRLFETEKSRLEKLMADYRAGKEVTMREVGDLTAKVEDLGIKYSRALGRSYGFENWPDIWEFGKNGSLFVGVLALFGAAQHLMKVSDIKANISNRNQAEFALQDALEDNKNNLYAFLEQLPNKTRNDALAYISENHFDEFQNQTDNLLYALAVLEKSSLNATHKNQKDIEQQVNNQFDKTYKNTEKKIKHDALNM